MSQLISRQKEFSCIKTALELGRHVLLEGPVGVGKTHLATAVTQALNKTIYRIDGDARFTEQKLTGWFDPPTVLTSGYGEASFVAGPLVLAMKSGGVLFINELNRLPEGVQNVLLPAIDEKLVNIPRLGEIRAQKGFAVIATQNPKEFVATSHLSEAILDRFELVLIDYQSADEEIAIVMQYLKKSELQAGSLPLLQQICEASVNLTRLTREHDQISRGASVRAALSTAELTAAFLTDSSSFEEAFTRAVLMALPNRIELEHESSKQGEHQTKLETVLRSLIQQVLSGSVTDKKKIQ